MTEEWRKLHNDEINYLYYSPNIFLEVKKSKEIRWEEHVARMGKRRGVFRFWWGNLKERGYLGDPGVDGKII